MRLGPDLFGPAFGAAKSILETWRRALVVVLPGLLPRVLPGARSGLTLFLTLTLSVSMPQLAQAQTQAQNLSEQPATPTGSERSFLVCVLDEQSNVMLVLDASGSMGQTWLEGESKYEAARRAVISAVGGSSDLAKAGAVTFGHRRNFDCSDIEVLSNPTASSGALARAMLEESPQARGMRSLADAIETAAARLSQQEGPGAIIVLTDGAEECGGNS